MAKTKKATGNSIFWKAQEPGDFIEGKFIQFGTSPMGKTLELDNGVVGINVVLHRLCGQAFTDGLLKKPGAKVRVELKETKKLPKGHRVLVYRLFVNGVEVLQKFAPATTGEMAEFFAAKYEGVKE